MNLLELLHKYCALENNLAFLVHVCILFGSRRKIAAMKRFLVRQEVLVAATKKATVDSNQCNMLR